MRKLLALMLIMIPMSLVAQHKIELTIKGIEKVKGTILVAVYNSKDTFMKKHVLSAKQKVTGKEVTVVIEDVKSGDYAITTFHDENDNEKLDTNFIGIPNEPYGFSNDAKGSFGPPSFEKAKVKVDSDKKLVITLK